MLQRHAYGLKFFAIRQKTPASSNRLTRATQALPPLCRQGWVPAPLGANTVLIGRVRDSPTRLRVFSRSPKGEHVRASTRLTTNRTFADTGDARGQRARGRMFAGQCIHNGGPRRAATLGDRAFRRIADNGYWRDSRAHCRIATGTIPSAHCRAKGCGGSGRHGDAHAALHRRTRP